MIKVQVKTVVLCMVIFFGYMVFFPASAKGAFSNEIEMVADQMEYDPVTGIITATGNVEFRQDDIIITTNQLFYCEKDEIVRTEERVRLRSSSFDLTGESMWYSLSTEQGEIKKVKGKSDDLYFSGEKGIISPDDMLVQTGSYTQCCLDIPCYSIHAKKVTIEEDIVKTGFGWFALKGVKVLPLPPVKFSTEDRWPDVQVGYTSEKGFFVSGTLHKPLAENLRLSYGGTLGTKNWQSLDGGVNWQSGKVSMTAQGSLVANGNHRVNGNMSYSDSWGRLSANFREEWGDDPERITLFQFSRGLFPKTSGILFWQSEEWGAVETYGVRFRGRWIPGVTLGLGMVHGSGKLGEKRLGWHPETSVNLAVNLTDTWRLTAGATYLWSRDLDPDDGVWRSQQVSLTKDLHCFAVGVNYDFIEDYYEYTFQVKW